MTLHIGLEDELHIQEVLPCVEIWSPGLNESRASVVGELRAVFVKAADLGTFSAPQMVLSSYLICGGTASHIGKWCSFSHIGR